MRGIRTNHGTSAGTYACPVIVKMGSDIVGITEVETVIGKARANILTRRIGLGLLFPRSLGGYAAPWRHLFIFRLEAPPRTASPKEASNFDVNPTQEPHFVVLGVWAGQDVL